MHSLLQANTSAGLATPLRLPPASHSRHYSLSLSPPVLPPPCAHLFSLLQTNTNATLGITDQLALNMLLDQNAGAMQPTQEDPRVILLRNGTLRLHPLPVLRFPGGHVGFVQCLPWRWVGMHRLAGWLGGVGGRGE